MLFVEVLLDGAEFVAVDMIGLSAALTFEEKVRFGAAISVDANVAVAIFD